jgi:hypothetical protein
VKFKGAVSVGQIQKLADEAARSHRELDAKIQEANWRTDLKR